MPSQTFEALVEKDRNHLWHPYTQSGGVPLLFTKGQGASLYTEKGEKFLDGISSWWVNLHGHCHPYIAEQIASQAKELEHVIFTDFTHPPAIDFATRLLKILPEGFSRVFYSDNGSTAVESALKMAIQYWKNLGIKKRKILSLKGGYHGDTFGAMSLSGKNSFTAPFEEFLFEVSHLDEMEKVMKENDVICFIYEPFIQGAFGMRTYALEPLLEIAKKHEALLIADEVLTGFGRCGPLFASNLACLQPDIICLSKGITGGFLPLGATCCREEIYRSFSEKTFFHGHSYTGNPLSCAAALASLDLLEKEACTRMRQHIHNRHQEFVGKWKGHPRLKRLEAFGTFLIIEYLSHPPSRHFFHAHNVILRPLGNVLYVLPPYCIQDEELEKIYHTIELTWT